MSWLKRKKKIKTLSPLEGYNRWAASYQKESNPIKDLSDHFIEKFLPGVTGKAVLDFGCGTGKFCAVAEAQHASRILGIDISPAMIEVAKRQSSKTEFKCEDISGLSIDQHSFDVVICALVMGHLEKLTPALEKLVNGLKPGGVFILTDFHPYLTLLQSKRTFFDVSSREYFEVRHYLHLFEEYFSVFSKHSMTVEVLEEPKFNDAPVIFGIRARKT
jgi:malonyl-CoA O-methyltransferase